METRSDGPLSMPRHRIENTYDYKHRRVRKVVKLLDVPTSTWTVQSDTRFLYDGGWNLLAEINATGDLLRSYLWGKDLSGTFSGAGGVGGLLALHIHSALDTPNAGTYFPAYDGNGNVLSLTKATDGTQAASYEYSPFGELLRTTGPAAKFNVIRFSTKYEDLETGLSYYGYRFYNAPMKRWLNRDPSKERDFCNLYCFIRNNPIYAIDRNGLESWGPIGGYPMSPSTPSDTGGPSVTEQLFTGPKDGEAVDNKEWFEKNHGDELEALKKEAIDAINFRVREKCSSKPQTVMDWGRSHFFNQSSMAANTRLGDVYVHTSNIRITWDCEKFEWKGDLVISDGLGFDDDPGGMFGGGDTMMNLEYYQYRVFGDGNPVFSLFPDRGITRGTWQIDGSGECTTH